MERNIKTEVLKIKDEIIALRRYFHQHPEPSLKEFQTAKKIQEELDKLEIPFEVVGETGTIATIIGKKGSGKTILLRADIDALELEDAKDKSYCSQNPGLHHACGHDGHTAALLGAAKVLKHHEHQISGIIKLVFQQAEEIGAGARLFIEAGHLEGVDEVFSLHLDSSLPVGTLASRPGAIAASCDIFKIKVHGVSAHVSQPHVGKDALVAASSMVCELQKVVAREVDPIDSVVVGIGVLRAGTRYNIVANLAELEGTVRAFSHESRRQVLESVERIAKHVAAAHQTEIEFEVYDAAAPVINHPESASFGAKVASEIVGVDHVITAGKKALGADDFADFLALKPGVYTRVGTANSANVDTQYPHHHEKFDIDEEGLIIAAQYYALYALRYLED